MSGQGPPSAPLADDEVDHLLGQIVQEQMAHMRHHEHEQILMMQQQMAHLQQQHLVQMQHLQQMAQMQGGAQMVPGGAQMVPGGAQMVPGGAQMVPGGAQMVPGGDSPLLNTTHLPNIAHLPNMTTSAAPTDAPADGLAGLKVHCPLRTKLPHSCQEETLVRNGEDAKLVGEIKAYKLGKKRWSYNQVDVVLKEKGGKRELFSKQAIHKGVAASDLMDMGGITYQVTLNNDEVIQVHTFLVYEDGKEMSMNGEEDASSLYEWELVNRGDCNRGCQGSTLRALQRFGRLGKRTASNCNTPRSAGGSQANSAASTPAGGAATGGTIERSFSNMKDPKYMYLSLDEAVTHVQSKNDVPDMGYKSPSVRFFRLVCGAYAGTDLISTSVSPPIRVLANNDVPGGAAHIEIQLEVESSWSGWDSTFEPLQLQFSQGMGQSMSMSVGVNQGGNQGMSQGMNQGAGHSSGPGAQPSGANRSLPTLNLASPSTKDIGRIHSDESMFTPQRLSSQLRKTMSVSSAGQKRVSSLLEDQADDMVLRRTQSMKKGKQMINLTARADMTRGLASPFTKMQVTGEEDVEEAGQSGDAKTPLPDPVSAFVDLMMTTFESSPKEEVPVVEIPEKPSPLNLAAIDDSYLDSLLGAIHSNTTFPDTVDVDIYGKQLER